MLGSGIPRWEEKKNYLQGAYSLIQQTCRFQILFDQQNISPSATLVESNVPLGLYLVQILSLRSLGLLLWLHIFIKKKKKRHDVWLKSALYGGIQLFNLVALVLFPFDLTSSIPIGLGYINTCLTV